MVTMLDTTIIKSICAVFPFNNCDNPVELLIYSINFIFMLTLVWIKVQLIALHKSILGVVYS